MADDDTTSSTVDTAVETTTPAAPSTPASPPAETAPSPSATPSGETRESLLDAVQQAVPELRSSRDDEGSEGQGASPASAAKSDQPQSLDDVDDDGTLPDDVSPEELAKYSQSAKRRIKRLSTQRRQLSAEVERLKTYEGPARAADSVTTYLRDNDIGREDFLLTLELAAAMRRGDFKTFYEGIQPYMRLAEEYLGVALPGDLQQAVRAGHMTTEAAQRFSRERMDRALAQSQAQRQSQAFQQQQQQFTQQHEMQRREMLANNVRDQVNTWERTVMSTDPDYSAKRTAVQETMWAVVREKGAPQSPDEAIGIAREAYRRVNERYRSWAQPRRPTSRSPSSTGRTTGAAPEAKTLLDAIKNAREGARL
jgi:hypothetical protein